MTNDDPVAEAVDQYLAYLENGGDEPSFDDLPEEVRREVDDIVASLTASRGIDPYASPPSVETLVAGTEFEGVFGAVAGTDPSTALDAIRDAITALNTGCRVDPAVDEEGHGLIARRRDLVIYLFVQRGGTPAMTGDARRRAVGVFAKPDVARVCIVGSDGPDHLTLALSPADLGLRYTAPDGARVNAIGDPQPLELAFQHLLQLCAPEWDPVDLSTMDLQPTQLDDVAMPIIREMVAREAGRAYRGDKAVAYRSMVGREPEILAIVSGVVSNPEPFDAESAVAIILGEAA